MSGKSLGKAMKTANKKGIPYVIIIGEEELKQDRVGIKDMKSGEAKGMINSWRVLG